MFTSRYCPYCHKPRSGKPPYPNLCARHSREKQQKGPDHDQ